MSEVVNLTQLTPPVPQMNLNWKPILKNILDDPEGFIGDGGWDFLDAEGGSASEGEEGAGGRGAAGMHGAADRPQSLLGICRGA